MSALMEAFDCVETTSYKEGYAAGKADAVKHAHWEMVELKVVEHGEVYNTGRRVPMCSHCRHADPEFRSYFHYCPDCGAVMDEEVVVDG